MWTEEVREERDQFCVFCRDQAQTNWVKMFDKLHPIVLCLGKPSKKKRQKKLNFFNFGGVGKNFPKFNFLKDLFKIRFKPF